MLSPPMSAKASGLSKQIDTDSQNGDAGYTNIPQGAV
jgi:hypothetical protein